MQRRTGVEIGQCDTYVNIAGGMRVTEPALDLPIILALWSCYRNRPLEPHTVAFGEVGLTGELRSVTQPLLRVREAMKLGYRSVILAQSDCDSIRSQVPADIKLYGLSNIGDLKK